MKFKRGVYIVCKDNYLSGRDTFLTIGKIYRVVEDSYIDYPDYNIAIEFVYVINNMGEKIEYNVNRFVLLSEYRIDIINEILV